MKPFPNAGYVELHVPDFGPIKDYYQKLGFEILWQEEPSGHKGYIVFNYQNNIIAFWCGNQEVYDHPYFKNYSKDTPPGFGVEMVIMVNDIDAFYNRVKSFANVVEELKVKPWGLKDFRTADPYGFYLRFSESDDISKPQPSK
jgi:uncharacterized glyoxalase superfamily protein PhnB